MHFFGFFVFVDEPDVAQVQPVIRQLLLSAVVDLLLKDAVFVANRHAVPENPLRCERVEKTRSKPSKPPVAQTGVRFDFFQLLQVKSEFFDCFLK